MLLFLKLLKLGVELDYATDRSRDFSLILVFQDQTLESYCGQMSLPAQECSQLTHRSKFDFFHVAR